MRAAARPGAVAARADAAPWQPWAWLRAPRRAAGALRGAGRSLHAAGGVAGATRGEARLQAAADGAAGPNAEDAARRGRGRTRKPADGAAGGEAAQAEPPKQRQRAPKVGKTGEKTADGKPKPDERTVADLVRRGWFESEEAVVALLTRAPSRRERFAFETAKPTADWLEATLGLEPLKGGVLPAAKAVKLFPGLLFQDAAALQRKWDALTLPADQGGVGCMFSEEQAREAILKRPLTLGYSMDTLKRGWLMLTATVSGLGLSPDEARSCILRSSEVLRFDHDAVVRRVELLKSLGYPEAYEMVLAQSRVLNFKEETVKEHAAWWKQTGLDHVKIAGTNPLLLGAPTTTELRAKRDFLRRVAGMSTADLNKAGDLFSRSLEKRLRARYFFALLKGQLARFTSMSTMFKATDATFLAMLQGQTTRGRASELEVARYQKLVKSAKFVAWRERQEALILRTRAGTDDAPEGHPLP